MKLSEKSKRRLVIAGLGVVCIALVIMISSRFKAEAPADAGILPSSTISSEVNPDIDPAKANQMGESEMVVKPIDQSQPSTPAQDTGTGDSTGTDQAIQSDPVKPTAPTTTPVPQGDNTNPSSPPTYKPEDTIISEPAEPEGGEKKDGKIYVPGFGWIEDHGGGTQQTEASSDGDINKQVGSMGGD